MKKLLLPIVISCLIFSHNFNILHANEASSNIELTEESILNNFEDVIIEESIIEDNIIEDNIIEESIIENNSIEDNSIEDNSIEDNSIENNSIEDNSIENNSIEDNSNNLKEETNGSLENINIFDTNSESKKERSQGQYTFRVTTNEYTKGEVNYIPFKLYKEGDTVEIKATPKAGYEFSHWEVNSHMVKISGRLSSSATVTIPAANVIVYAHFRNIGQKVSLISMSANFEGGDIHDKSGYYQPGEEIVVEAYPNQGYTFLRWEADDGHILTPNLRSTIYTVGTKSVTLNAVFIKVGAEKFHLKVETNLSFPSRPVIIFENYYGFNEIVNIVAPDKTSEGYGFSHWVDFSNSVEGRFGNRTSPKTTYRISGDTTLVAHYYNNTSEHYNVNVKTTSTYGGSIGDYSGKYMYFTDEVPLHVLNIKEGYDFKYWEVIGTASGYIEDKNSMSTKFVFQIPIDTPTYPDLEIKAIFAKNDIHIMANTFAIDKILDNAQQVSADSLVIRDCIHSNKIVVINSTSNHQGHFYPGLILGLGGEATHGVYDHGDSLTLKAEPDKGYEFHKWIVKDKVTNELVDIFYSQTITINNFANDLKIEAFFDKISYTVKIEPFQNLTVKFNGVTYQPTNNAIEIPLTIHDNYSVTAEPIHSRTHDLKQWELTYYDGSRKITEARQFDQAISGGNVYNPIVNIKPVYREKGKIVISNEMKTTTWDLGVGDSYVLIDGQNSNDLVFYEDEIVTLQAVPVGRKMSFVRWEVVNNAEYYDGNPHATQSIQITPRLETDKIFSFKVLKNARGTVRLISYFKNSEIIG